MNAETIKIEYDQGLATKSEAITALLCVTGFDRRQAGEFLDGLRDQVLVARSGAGRSNLLVFPR